MRRDRRGVEQRMLVDLAVMLAARRKLRIECDEKRRRVRDILQRVHPIGHARTIVVVVAGVVYDALVAPVILVNAPPLTLDIH